MKKNLMAVLTASSVAVMAMGATLAAYAEPDAGESPYVRDEPGNFEFTRNDGKLIIQTNDGFTKWQDEEFAITKESIEEIEFGQDVTEIPKDAFAGLPNLEMVSFYSGYDGTTNIEKIGENAFKGCKSLKIINFPTSFYNPEYDDNYNLLNPFVIGKGAFQDCTALENLSFNYAVVTEIGESAFEGCKSLISVDFGQYNDNLRIIGDRAFYGCESITNLAMSPGLERIGSRAFANCKTLYYLNMKDCSNLELIDELAFFNCVSLRVIKFPNDGTGWSSSWDVPPKHTIKKWAFRNCPWLDGIILSSDVGTVEEDAFFNCKNLKYIGYNQSAEGASISVPEGVTLFSFDKLEYDEIVKIIGKEPEEPVEPEMDYNFEGLTEEEIQQKWVEYNQKYAQYEKDREQWYEDSSYWSSQAYGLNYQITVKNQPQNEDGKIFLPEKFSSDADILKIVDFNGTEHEINLPRHGASDGSTIYWYDFSQIPDGYEMIVNVSATDPVNPTARSEEELYDRRPVEGAKVEYDLTSKSGYIPFINSGTAENDPSSSTPESSEPESSDSSSSEPTSSTPPPYVPPINDDDPVEPDPDSSDDSSEPESSEPESSEPESSEPTSGNSEDESNPSKPTDVPHGNSDSVNSLPNPPDNNPNTGVRFFAPAIVAGAAVVVVVARRRKMK